MGFERLGILPSLRVPSRGNGAIHHRQADDSFTCVQVQMDLGGRRDHPQDYVALPGSARWRAAYRAVAARRQPRSPSITIHEKQGEPGDKRPLGLPGGAKPFRSSSVSGSSASAAGVKPRRQLRETPADRNSFPLGQRPCPDANPKGRSGADVTTRRVPSRPPRRSTFSRCSSGSLCDLDRVRRC